MVWEREKKKIKYKFHSDLHWITSSCPCLYWAIWSFIRIQNSCGKRSHSGRDISFKGIAGWPIKMKRLNVVVTGPQAALSDSFISGVLRWGLKRGGRGRAGDTLFPKSVRVNSAVHRPGAEVQKQAAKNLCSPISKFIINVSRIFTPHKVSFKTFEFLPGDSFLLQMWGRNKKEIRKKALWGDYSQKAQHPTWIFLLKASWFT